MELFEKPSDSGGWMPAFLGLLLATLAGCTVKFPDRCTEDTECEPGSYCDLGTYECVPTQCGNGVREGDESCDGTPRQRCWILTSSVTSTGIKA